MAATIPTREPTEFVQGETVKWTKSLTDYTPDDGWELSYAFVLAAASTSQQTVTATDNGDGTHLVTIPASGGTPDSGDFSAGRWRWQAKVTDGTSVYLVGSGTVEVKTSFAAASSGYDDRSHAKKALDAIEAVLEGKAAEDISGYSLPDGRSVSKMTHAELLAARNFYRREYANEQAAEQIANGLGNPKKARVRFTGRH